MSGAYGREWKIFYKEFFDLIETYPYPFTYGDVFRYGLKSKLLVFVLRFAIERATGSFFMLPYVPKGEAVSVQYSTHQLVMFV